MLDLLHNALNIVSGILIFVYVIMPILSKVGDGLVWIWRCITGTQVPKKEQDYQKILLAESKAFMKQTRR